MKVNINFIGARKPAMIVSLLLIIISIWMVFGPKNLNIGILTPRGFNLGVDFKGGLQQHITVYSGISQEDVRSISEKSGLGNDIQQVIIPEEKKLGNATSYIIRTIINENDQKEMNEKDITAAKYFENKSNEFFSMIRQKTGKDVFVIQGSDLKKANELYKIEPITGELIDQKTDTQRVVENVVREGVNVTSSNYSQILQRQALTLISIALAIILVYVLIRFGLKFSIGGIF